MRSSTPSARRPHRRRPRAALLPAVATIVDQATLDVPGHVLVHITDPVDPEVALGLKPIDAQVHPFQVLAGFTAPDDWGVFGIRGGAGRTTWTTPPPAPRAPR